MLITLPLIDALIRARGEGMTSIEGIVRIWNITIHLVSSDICGNDYSRLSIIKHCMQYSKGHCPSATRLFVL